MHPERRSRIEAIRNEQMGREHGYHELPKASAPSNFENARDMAAQREAYNSKEGYC